MKLPVNGDARAGLSEERARQHLLPDVLQVPDIVVGHAADTDRAHDVLNLVHGSNNIWSILRQGDVTFPDPTEHSLKIGDLSPQETKQAVQIGGQAGAGGTG